MTEIKSLIRTISRISDNFSAVIQQILDNHPNFDQTKDSRITTFTSCIVVLDGIYICLIVRGFELRKPEWWTEKRSLIGEIRRPVHDEDVDTFVKGFDSFTVTAYFNLLFIALENGFRTFYKVVCPTKKVPKDFKNIYDDILRELQLIRYFDLMQILRMGRNACMHTNGIHTRGNDQVTWSGITVTYTKGKPVDYGADVWDALTQISQGIVDMLREILISSKVMQEQEIIDPSYA
jgi:hypothetical protein